MLQSLVENSEFGDVLLRVLPGSVILPMLAIILVIGVITMPMHLLKGYVTGWGRGQFLLNATLWFAIILGTGLLTYSVALSM